MFGLTLQMVGSPERSRWGKAGGVLDLCLPPGERAESEYGGSGADQQGKGSGGWKRVLTRDASELNMLTD